MAKVSVIIPAYNSADFLPECLTSICSQTENSLQIIIINDGSTDQTFEIAEQYAKYDSRIHVIDQPNSGVSAARNRGIEAAIGDYLCFIDSDDWVEPHMIETMLNKIEEFNADVLMSGAMVEYRNKDEETLFLTEEKSISCVVSNRAYFPSHLISDSFINLIGFTWNKLYRRQFLDDLKIRFDSKLSLYEDLDFNVVALTHAKVSVFIPDSFVHYVQRPRDSLVSKRGDDFLALSAKAQENVDHLLEYWKIPPNDRMQRRAQASAGTLWAILNVALMKNNPLSYLRSIATHSEVHEFLKHASNKQLSGFRYRLALYVFEEKKYGLGLIFCRITYPFRLYRGETLRAKYAVAKVKKLLFF